MNILAIHSSHDGSITIVKNNTFFAHAQIDRFTHVVSITFPPTKLLKSLKNLNIQFDAVIFTYTSDSCHRFWEEQLIKFDLLNRQLLKYLFC